MKLWTRFYEAYKTYREKNGEKVEAVAKKVVEPDCFVFDASIATETNLWKEIIDEIIKNGQKLVLTNTVLDELAWKQNYYPSAKELLEKCAEDDKHFFYAVIQTPPSLSHSDCLINYAQQKQYGLITADVVMVLEARMRNIHVEYVKKAETPSADNISNENSDSPKVSSKPSKANSETTT